MNDFEKYQISCPYRHFDRCLYRDNPLRGKEDGDPPCGNECCPMLDNNSDLIDLFIESTKPLATPQLLLVKALLVAGSAGDTSSRGTLTRQMVTALDEELDKRRKKAQP